MTSSALFRRRRQAESVSRVVAIKASAEGGKFGFSIGTQRCVLLLSQRVVKEHVQYQSSGK